MEAEQRELIAVVGAADDLFTMLQACVQDREWLFASLTLTGLTDQLGRLRALLEAQL